jgi:hypothetical protein
MLSICLILTVLLAGCAQPELVAPTVVVTTMPVATATVTLTPMPSATPTVTATPAQPLGVDRATFVSETYPDYTVLAPGEQFIKTWNIKNTGTSTWNTTYKLARVATPQNETLGSPIEIPFPQAVPPGAAAALSIPLTAPKAPGTYAVYWSLENERKQSFGVDGDRVWVLIKVCVTGQSCPQAQANAAASANGISASLSSFTTSAQASTASFCMTLPNRNYAPAPGSVSLLLDQQVIMAATGSSLPGGCYEFEFPVSATQIAQAKSAAVSIGQVRILGGVADPQAACLAARLKLMERYPGLDFQCGFSQTGYYTNLQLPAGLDTARADALIVDAIEGAVDGPWLLNVKN